MRSATIWTSASHTHNKVFYYRTQHNRRVREDQGRHTAFDGHNGDRFQL